MTTEPEAPEWRSAGIRSPRPQGEGDLGSRLENALRRALAGGKPAAIVIGTDSPDLPAELLDAARAALKDADAVLGPSADGGFYLIGLRSCPEGLLVPARVRVSGRRFLARPLYYFLLVNLMPLFYALGVPATRLVRLYGDPR